jgi:hypothetical protein
MTSTNFISTQNLSTTNKKNETPLFATVFVVDNTTNKVANKGVSFFLLIASATGCTKQGLRQPITYTLNYGLVNSMCLIIRVINLQIHIYKVTTE